MTHAKQIDLEALLDKYGPMRITTPKETRERIRYAIEQGLKTCAWKVNDTRYIVQTVLLSSEGGWGFKVRALSSGQCDPTWLEMDLVDWMEQAVEYNGR